MKLFTATSLLCASSAIATTYFSEKFGDGDAWKERWIQSGHNSDYGKFDLTPGKYYADEKDVGLTTTQDAKFYAMSTKFDDFSNEDKDLVVQFSVKHAQKIDCGGGYVKVFPSKFEPTEMHGETEYNLMFGPDICGYSTKKVHVIFSYNGKNHLIKKEIKCKDDELTHVYTLHLKSDNSYEVLIDGESAQKGSLESDWDLLEPKEIKDPEAKKPDNWVNDAKMDDPEDVKPEGYDDIPEFIADPEAVKPEDWDEDMDGEWEAPMVNNENYKGEWKAQKIDNPDFKGPWVHPMIDNPEHVADANLYKYESWGALGLDLWQVKSGSVFDNFLISDDIEEATKEAKQIVADCHEGEEKMKKVADDIADAEEKAAAEAAGQGGEEDMGDDEEMDIDEDEETGDMEDDSNDDEFDDDFDESEEEPEDDLDHDEL